MTFQLKKKQNKRNERYVYSADVNLACASSGLCFQDGGRSYEKDSCRNSIAKDKGRASRCRRLGCEVERRVHKSY